MDKIIERLAEHSAGSNNNAFERAEHMAGFRAGFKAFKAVEFAEWLRRNTIVSSSAGWFYHGNDTYMTIEQLY